jgi:uncharacterized protein (TIGR03437 family)
MQNRLFRFFCAVILLATPLPLAAASYLFVFDGASPTATVYDAQNLERVASPAVGRRASYAFGVPDPADARQFSKFYIVSESAVAILNADFSSRGNLFLPEPVARGSHAASLSLDGRRLLVAAGNSVYVIDTKTDEITAVLEPGFSPTSVVALPGSERAYVSSNESRFLRVIDLQTNELLDTTAELPVAPSALAASPNGSKLYATSPGAIYDLNKLTPDFFQPVSALKPRQAGVPFVLGTTQETGPEALLKNEAPDSLRNPRLVIDRLVLTNSERFVLRVGNDFLRGRLDPESPFVDFLDPASGERYGSSDIAAVAASADGAALFFATSKQPRLIKSDSSCSVEERSVDLGEAPTAMALVAGPIEQQNCNLPKTGDGAVVVENTAFTLQIGNSSTPVGGVQADVTTSPPNIVNCNSFLITGGGPTSFVCDAGDVAGNTEVTITVTSPLGCATYEITVVPQGASVNGLTKIFGDGISILRNTTFQLLVEARADGTPQGGLPLNIGVVPSTAVVCPTNLTTASNGVATLNCAANNINTNTVVQITVTDATDMSRTVTFEVTVLTSGNPSSGLNKVSADPRTVASEQEFELSVQAFSGTTPQSGLLLTISPDSTFLTCATQAVTNSAGLADIPCTAVEVTVGRQVRVTVGDGTRSVVFIVNVVPSGELVDGLSIVSGNNQFVPRQSAFPLPLVVRAVSEGMPQEGLQLTILPSSGLAFCSAAALTDENGIGTINCSAAFVNAANFITINVRDELGRELPEPFDITILNSAPGIATDITILSPMTVEGGVGDTLEAAIQARATGPSGVAQGVPVFFASNDDLNFNPPVAITDINGEVTTDVIFGCPTRSTGMINVGLEAGQSLRTVNYRAVRGPLAGSTKERGDNQSGAAGQILSQALVIIAGDACGNGVPGLPVEWTIDPPEAAELVVPIVTVTDANGRASTRVRLANRSGPFTITASVEGFNSVFNLASTTVADSLVVGSGNNQSVVLGQSSTQPLVARVLSDNDIGVNGVNVTFNVISGSGTVSPGTVTTDGQGNAAATVQTGSVLGPIIVEATAVIQEQTRTVQFTVNTVGRAPEVTLLGFVNGASFEQGWVPGSTGTIFGVGLMEGVDGVFVPNVFPFPTEVQGVSVTVNGVQAPILGLANVNGQEQINIQVPFSVAAPGQAAVVINNNGSSTTITGVQVLTVQPGFFQVGVEGGLFVAALHADFQLVTPSNPARPGEVILLFLTGLGATNPAVGTNVAGPTPPAQTVLQPTVELDGVPQAISGNTAFYAPQLVTVYQINIVVAADAQSGNRTLTVSIGGVNSPPVQLPVQQ